MCQITLLEVRWLGFSPSGGDFGSGNSSPKMPLKHPLIQVKGPPQWPDDSG